MTESTTRVAGSEPSAGVGERPLSLREPTTDTIVGRLRRRAREAPARLAYTWLADGEAEEGSLTWGALEARATVVARQLAAAGVARGDRALLLFPPGLDFIAAFFGCLAAGVVAVPAYPPRSLRRPEREGERLAGIALDAAPRAVLTTSEIAAAGPALAAGVPALRGVAWLAAEVGATAHDGAAPSLPASPEPVESPEPPEPAADAIAFLQYTSGSTSEPKGVIVTHGNLAANEAAIASAFGQDEDSVVVGWLPLYHDMGLIGNVLQPLWSGGRCVLMSPVAFLQRPARWLEAIARYRATTSGGPDFAYALAARKTTAEEAAALDLSSWRVAFSGAEPVRAETLAAFARAFAPSGFRREAFYPCYGLAEATLFVAGPERGRVPAVEAWDAAGLERHEARKAFPDEPGARRLVGCGDPRGAGSLAIVDPETCRPCPEGRIGEIWIAGPSIARGYWNRPELSAEAFGARIVGAEGPGAGPPHLRTGDLGFVAGGHLFVTGRLKDLVILRGRNHYPQDLERTAEASHGDLQAGGAAAFSIEADGEERLVVVAEVTRHARAVAAEIEAAVRDAIAQRHEVQVAAVALLKPATLPKTTSGKVRRRATRQAFLEGGLAVWEEATRSDPRNADPAPPGLVSRDRAVNERVPPPGEKGVAPGLDARGEIADRGITLRAAAAAALAIPVERLDPERPLTAQGLDSLSAVELQLAAGRLGIAVSFADLLDGATLADLLARPLATATDAAELRPHDLAVPAPLSFEQEALYFAERLAPGAYTIAVAARVDPGALDGETLERALAEVVRRHPALGATFDLLEGEPVCRFPPRPNEPGAEPVERSVEEVDRELLARSSDAALAESLGALLGARLLRPFDLARGPLVRLARLVTEAGETVAIGFAVHHLVADFTSLALVAREISELYRAEVSCRLAALPLPPALTPGDVARFRRARFESSLEPARRERLLADRAAEFADVADLELPTDRPRPASAGYRGRVAARALDRGAAAALFGFARAQGATPFALLAAVWSALLARLAGQGRFALAAPTAGRARPGLDAVVGYLVQPVAMAVDLADDPPFAGHLERIRKGAAAAIENADLPLSWLAERLRGGHRDPSRPALAQVAVSAERESLAAAGGASELAGFAFGLPGATLEFAGIDLRALALPERRAPFELTLEIAAVGGVPHLVVEGNADLFDRSTLDRLLGRVERLLAGASASPLARLLDLPLLDDAERAQLLALASDRAVAIPAAPPLVGAEVFARAGEQPERDAVRSPDGVLTYGALAARALALAGSLRALGVGPESFVALLCGRSLDAVIGQLGTLWAGAAFVPLDPAHPDARLTDEIADARPAALLAAPEQVERARALFPAGVVLVPSEVEPETAAEGARASGSGRLEAPVEVDPRHPAYAIFTSGSTGRPKGVVIDHGGLANLVAWHRAAYRLSADDRTPLLAGPGFDAAVWETWPTLAAGACLSIAPEALRTDPERLPGWLATEGATVAFLSTPVAEAALGEPWPEELALRALLTGGDRLRRPPRPGLPFALVNHYGPTEGAVVATSGVVPPASAESTSSEAPVRAPSIGRPIAGARVFVGDRLGPCGRWAPAGAAGELLLGGAGLARGYLGRPDLTAERFVPDPFSGRPGERLYRTGDLVRLDADGALDFLGRIDHQVKVRGQRIELGEIEARLLAHPAVREAAVLPFGEFGAGADAATRLVGFVVPEPGTSMPADLGRWLRERLPEAMVPSAFVELASLPLTANGKLDRRALTPPPAAPESAEAIAPRDAVEAALAAAVAEVLGRPSVSVFDDFSALGIHSLAATRVAGRAARALGVEVPLAWLFEESTIAGLAARLRGTPNGEVPDRRLGSLPRPARPRLSFPQRRLWFLERLTPGTATYHIAGAIELAREPLAGAGPSRLVGDLRHALALLAARHEAFRTSFPEIDGEPYQRVAPEGPSSLGAEVDLAALPAAADATERDRLAAALAGRPFDLAGGPLVRFAALRREAGAVRLVAVFHHLIADGASVALFAGELATALAALGAGRDPQGVLGPPPLQPIDVALGQLAADGDERQTAAIAYFRERLADLPPLELPTDHPRGARRSAAGGVRRLALSEAATAGATAAARSAGATPFMLHATVLAALLARLSGQPAVAVGTPIANRRAVELEAVFGFLANTLVLDARVADDPPVAELLARVRASALGAYAREDLPFERLVEAIAPRRELAHNPLFEVLLVEEEPLVPRRAGAVHLAPSRLPTGTAKFDLTLALVPRGDGGVDLDAEYASDLFDPSTVDRWLGAYSRLLEATAAALAPSTAAAADLRLSDLPLLSAAERTELDRWSEGTTSSDISPLAELPELLHAGVFARAAAAPGATALVALADDGGSEVWTYGRLAERAAAIAAGLRRRGLGPEERVGVLLPREPALVAALLGVLAAGGAYVPLDPAYPDERLRLLLDDSGARFLIATPELAARLDGYAGEVLDASPEGAGPHPLAPSPGRPEAHLAGEGERDREARGFARDVVSASPGSAGAPAGEAGAAGGDGLGRRVPSPGEGPGQRTAWDRGKDGMGVVAEPAVAETPRIEPDQIAYLIYTSGSTGRPKSVAIPHRSAAVFIRWALAAFPPAELSGVLFATSVCFDLSIFELFAPLSAGGAVLIATDALDLPRVAARAPTPVTLVNTVPSALAELVADGSDGRGLPASVRSVNLAGEPLPGPLVAAIFASSPGVARVNNLYGPSEDTTYSTWAEIPRAEAGDPRTARRATGAPPIGRPLPGTRAFVVGPLGEQLAAGVAGELLLGGPGLARGYLGRPDLTAERFVPDPFSGAGHAGARLYRTGDRARWIARAGGAGLELEMLGRLDQQVKIRGFRVELGEVQAALLDLAGVREAAALALGDGGARRLAAAVAIDGDEGQDADAVVPDLKAALARRLPAALVPSAFVLLRELPRLPNGKLDRRRLAIEVDSALAARGGRETEPPRGEAEETVAAVFCEVLGLAAVGRDDDFFALGGHSLLATRAASRIGRAFGVDLPVSALFLEGTVAALAVRAGGGAESPLGSLSGIARMARMARGDGSEPQPLSFAQERLWFLERLDPGGAIYHLAGEVALSGRLDRRALARALSGVVERHEALRTALVDTLAGPRQIVRPPVALRLGPVDLSALAGERGEDEARRIALAAGRAAFDLARGEVLRARLVRLAPERHRLTLALHHAAADGWSLGLLIAEATEIYDAALAGRAPVLPELPVGVADFAVWQRRSFPEPSSARGGPLAGQLAAWTARLAGLEPLELPTDRPRPAVRSGRGVVRERFLPPERLAAIDALGRAQGATRFQTLFAGFFALLARLTSAGAADSGRLAVGTPVANRRQVEVEPLIGMFVNTLVVDVEAGDDPPFARLLERVRQAALGALGRQDVPFERLVEALGLPRDLARNPLVQVLFVLEEPLARRDVHGLAIEPTRLDLGVARFDWTLEATPARGGLVLAAEVDADLFDAATADRWLAGLDALLAAATAAPERRLSDLPLAAPAETLALLAAAEGPTLSPPLPALPALPTSGAELLHAGFFRQAALNPAALAVVGADGAWTYEELAVRALAVAEALSARGAGPEQRVGVLLPREPALVAALLGVLTAGCAYVPLDPAYPDERLRLLLDDSGARFLIATPELAMRLPGFAGEVVDASPESAARGGQAGPHLLAPSPGRPEAHLPGEGERARARTPIDPDQIAYLIYTSGSTGRPKSVAIPHRSAAAFVRWALASFSATELSGVLFATSVCFDLSIFELFAPLSSGGAILMADDALALPAVARRTEERTGPAISLVNTVPSALAELVRTGGLPATVRTVNLAGEALPGALVERIFATSPGVARVNNLYGPSEDTTYSTWAAIERTEAGSRRAAAPPIGRPLAGSRAYVAGRFGELAPAGVPGELLLGGAGLARGYLGRPELSAERFVPDGFSGRAGERLYRTGDRVRWLGPGGSPATEGIGAAPELEYLGRLDHQVKVRGFRVEIGEIETAIAGCAGVGEAAVAVVGEGSERRLVGLLAPAAGASAETLPAEVAATLRRALPGYLVPSALAVVDALPRLANGKLDRRRLLALAASARGAEAGATTDEPPRGPVEELVAAIFCQVLGRERIGALDGFFESGGHSLLAAQAASRLSAAFGVELPVRRLFEVGTVRALAAALEELRRERRADPDARPQPTLGRRADGSAPVLSFAQERLWFLDRLGAGAAYNLPAVVRLRGRLAPPSLAAALSGVVARHEPLRTLLPARDGRPEPAIAPPAAVPVPLVDLVRLGAPAAEARRLARDEAARPFDLERGPLLRALLLRLATDLHEAILDQHHIATDGWSLGVLLDEIGEHLRAEAEGRAPALPPLPVRYSDFAAWQRELLAGDEIARRVAAFRGALAGVPLELELPLDRPRPAVLSARSRGVAVAVPEALAAGLDALGRAAGATAFHLLLAAFGAQVGRLAGVPSLLVGAPVAGRNRKEIEPLIGLFVNTLPQRIDLAPPTASFAELVAGVRARALDALALADLPFERLVEELGVRRDPGRPPLVQVAFSFQAASPWRRGGRGTELPGLAIEAAGAERAAADGDDAKFELTLVLERLPAAEGGGFAGVLQGHADLFDRPTVRRWGDQFERLLAAAVAAPGRALADLDLLGPIERHQLLVEWSPGFAAAQPTPFRERVRERAREAPDRVAVVLAGRERVVSYGELDRRADRLSRRLLAMGVRGEERVAMMLERSPEAIEAILGILGAGAAYVPIDPSYPAERIAFLLGDSGAVAAVAASEDVERLAAMTAGVPVVAVEGMRPAAASERERGAVHGGPGEGMRPPDPDQLAYVIYTSGSTGVPKGVAITHRGMMAYADASAEQHRMSAEDRQLQFSTLSFDASIEEICGPLGSGAAIVLRERELLGAGELLNLCRDESISIGWVSTGYWHQLGAAIDSEGLAIPPSLRTFGFGGERTLIEPIDAWRRRAPRVRLEHAYGPTETTVIATRWIVPAAGALPEDLPIGHAMRHARIFVVDGELRPVPRGAVGEIVIGGAGLARGYLDRPEITAQKFVPDPFSARRGGRLYRTGDLGRMLPSGELVFAGRTDGQVKLRGFRVELGEIEAVLHRHPAVAAAAVAPIDPSGALALGRSGHTPSLGAWVMLRAGDGGEPPAASDLAAFVAERLPAHMVPAAFAFLAALPLNANGKIDRRALPPIPRAAESARATAAPPETALEATLAAAWCELFGVEQVGVHDNFFDLGGNSLALVRFHSRVQRDLGREFPLVRLFEHPTIRALAKSLDVAGEAAQRVGADLAAGRERGAARRAGLAELERRRQRARPRP